MKHARSAIKPLLAAVLIRPLSLFLLATGLMLCVPQALASPVQVMECQSLTFSGPTPSDSLTGDFIIRRHIEEAEPFQTIETDLWSQGKFTDEGYFEVTVIPLEGDPVTERSTSVQTTILDSDAFLGDEYLDEALTMEKNVRFEGYWLDSIALAFLSTDGTAIDTHLEVPPVVDRQAWDPYAGCSGFGCPVECAVTWHVPGDPVSCNGGNQVQFCSTGTYIGRIVSVTFEDHEHEHGAGFTMNAGLNDAWVNADAPFQGLFITVYPTLNIVFVAWFTFDSEIPALPPMAAFGAHDQRWATGAASINGNKATVNMELTSGGKFNSDDPLATQNTNYGTFDLEFSGCRDGLVRFDFPSLGESGEFTIKRVTDENAALCDILAAE